MGQRKLLFIRKSNVQLLACKLLVVCSLLAFGFTARSQQCGCAEKFAGAKKMFEEDYSGFADKVHEHTIKQYNRFVDSLTRQAQKNLSEYDCFALAKSYVQYFKDNHSGLYYITPAADATPEQIKDFYKSNTQSIDFSEKDYTAYLTKTKTLHPLEGIWNLGTNYRLAIMPNKKQKKQYEGIVVSSKSKYWFPGDVKMILTETGDKRYSALLLGGDHTPFTTTFRLIDGNRLDDSSVVLYKTAAPEFVNPIAQVPDAAAPVTSGAVASFKTISPYTSVLQILSFDKSNKRFIDSVVGSNWQTLITTPNLIIDIRNNGGGQDFVHDTLLSLAYTNEILNYDVLYRASPANIAEWRKWDKVTADSMEKYSGGYFRRPIKNRKHHTILPLPRQVVILTNKNVGSTGEQFILNFKQSGKVTVIGENTSGTLDYGEPKMVNVPCTMWRIRIPTSKHGRLPEYSVDANGIAPDVTVPVYEKDWVDFTRRFMEKRIGPGRQ